MNIENMVLQDNSLESFIKQSKERLKKILERLQWTQEDVLKNFNTNSKTALEKQKTELELPPSCASKNSIILEQHKLQELLGDSKVEVPQRFSDLQLNFNREQKLKIYEHVIERTEKFCEPEMSVSNLLNDNQMTFAEIVAAKTKEKKRKRRYRTSKPTHVEEVRGLVELQMQALQQYTIANDKEQKNKYPRESKKQNDKEAQNKHTSQSNYSNYTRERCKKQYEDYKYPYRLYKQQFKQSSKVELDRFRRSRSREHKVISRNSEAKKEIKKSHKYRSRSRDTEKETKHFNLSHRKRSQNFERSCSSSRNKYTHHNDQCDKKHNQYFSSKGEKPKKHKEDLNNSSPAARTNHKKHSRRSSSTRRKHKKHSTSPSRSSKRSHRSHSRTRKHTKRNHRSRSHSHRRKRADERQGQV